MDWMGVGNDDVPKQAEAYNGQQGDMWDAHKDMFLAFLGGIINLFTRLEQDNSWKKFTKNI